MVNKEVFVLGVLFLLLVPFCSAVEDSQEDWKNSFLFKQFNFFGQEVTRGDFILFVAVFVILWALVYGILGFIGLFKEKWIVILASFIVTFLMNIDGLLLRTVHFLKDVKAVMTWFRGLGPVQIILIALGICLFFLLAYVLRIFIQKEKEQTLWDSFKIDMARLSSRRKVEKMVDKIS